jgi:hypothetical protein
VNTRTLKRKTACKVHGITLNYATSQVVNFESIRGMILGADDREAISFRTTRKMKRKSKKCDGSGMDGADIRAIVSEPKEKVYRVSFHKRRLLEDSDSFFFDYIKDEHCSCRSQSVP